MTDDTETTVTVSVDTLGNQSAQDKAASTTQLDERRIATDIGRGIKPPYNPAVLASWLEVNETHAACVRKKARYEVGYGFDVVAHPEKDEPDEDQLEAVRDFWFGVDSRWKTGPEGTAASTPTEVLELARQDYHAIGWACLEITIDGDGTPNGLAHVPAWTVRVRKTETEDQDGETVVTRGHGYVQVRQKRRRFFGEAGDRYGDDPTFVDKETGEVADSVDDLENDPANELIFIPNPSPLSLYYGVPDWISAMQTMAADQAAKEWNHDIFDNLGIPYYAITVTGGTLTESSKEHLRELQEDLLDSPYRTAILEVDELVDAADPLEDTNGNSVEIDFEPIGAQHSEEMEFQAFRERNEHEIAKVHNVPPLLIGDVRTANRSNSKEQVRAFAQETIAPEQAKFESRLYHILHRTALEAPDWTIEFELRGVDQPEKMARTADRRIQAVDRAVLVGEAREAAGWPPLPDDAPISDTDLLADIGGGDPQQFDLEDQLPPPENKIGERDWSEVEAELTTKDPIEQVQFDSSNLDEGLFDFEDNELYLSFRRDEGGTPLYAYVNVPTTVWSGLVNAGSHGGYHYDNIRLEYPYIEITNFHDRLPEGPMPGADEMPEDVPV